MSGIAIFVVLAQFCRAWGSTATYEQVFLEDTTKLVSRLSPVSKQALRGHTPEKYVQAQRRLTSHAGCFASKLIVHLVSIRAPFPICLFSHFFLS